MAIDVSTRTTANSGKTTVTDWFETAHPNTTPFVRYGFPRDEGGQTQELKLRSLYESVPEGAITSSAIYFVTDDQLARLEKFADSPYAIKGSANIVKEIQGECEDAGRVRYPVYAESDARDDGVSFSTMVEWIRGFVEDELSVSPAECTFWYSGSRSIHVHLPKFLTHTQLTEIRRRAERFCEETGAELDTGIYKSKQQFRLPGATHRKSAGEFQKVRIDSSWENDRIIRTAGKNHEYPESYLDMIETTFSPQVDGQEFALTLDAPEDDIETPLIEQREYPENAYDVPEWSMYNAKEFSPYAHAGRNPRSLAVVEVKGGVFVQEDRRSRAPMVPVRFIAAVGCDESFTKEAEHGPLQLSEGTGRDYEKWVNGEYRTGDYVVIHGGQSRSSIIHSVTKIEALKTGFHLSRKSGGRGAARKYLSDQGYEVGASGSKKTTTSSGGTSTSESKEIWPARKNSGNPAEDLQRKAELNDIESLTHSERISVACRHLLQGWQPTWDWFKEQYGSDFKPDVTWEFLREIVEEPEFNEYEDVDVPDKPI